MIDASTDQVMEMAGITTLTGEGDYEGLTLYLSRSGDFLSQAYWGMIVPGGAGGTHARAGGPRRRVGRPGRVPAVDEPFVASGARQPRWATGGPGWG